MTNAKMDEYFVSHPEHSLTDRYLHYVSLDEMRAFIGLMILVGVFRASRDSLESLFSSNDIGLQQKQKWCGQIRPNAQGVSALSSY